ncbi:MAG: hypothetical protein NUV92_01620 [Ignavibacteria bacterium]|jgi:hypothetical protein|nr:hypothetical protein [Ignavibacteria bacterium]MDH7527685.1 hypothetical protein [Ignavibacteria bacterium]NPV10923.1 hypothetical protein [Ignavibacteria bacterium]
MAKPRFKFEMYKRLQQRIPQIYADAKKAAEKLNIPSELKGAFGLTGAISGCPSPLRDDIEHFLAQESKKVVPLSVYVEEIRAIIKEVYGDEFDAAPVNTCEGGLWITFDTLFTPPMQGRGDNYRTRYIAPLERHIHHQAGYGRPFPPKYKDILADRGCTAGELGFYGKRQNNLDTVFVPLEGAKYPVHGINYHPVPLLKNVDVEASLKKIEEVAERHQTLLSGFASLGYDTPGYGYGDKDENGIPKLQKGIAQIAKKYNVPYVIDNAWGIPIIGNNIKLIDADVMIYSMDKATGSATSGLIIGKEEVMVPIRRALGYHGNRYGTTASYGKAAYVTMDPGKEGLCGQLAALRALKEKPEIIKKPIDDLYEIVVDEFSRIDERIRNYFEIYKSYNSGAIEVNYEESWESGKLGIPIFTIEDMYSGSNLFQDGLTQMGIIPTIGYDANIFISPGLGTTDNNGQIIEERARMVVRGLVMLIEIVCEHAGIFE